LELMPRDYTARRSGKPAGLQADRGRSGVDLRVEGDWPEPSGGVNRSGEVRDAELYLARRQVLYEWVAQRRGRR